MVKSVVKFAVLATLAICQLTSAEYAKFAPAQVSYASLSRDDGAAEGVLEDALHDVGMVVVTGIPEFSQLRANVLREAVKCNLAMGASGRGSMFEDGTRRLTLAAESNYLSGHGQIDANVPECASFNALSGSFRDQVAEISQTFAHKVSKVFKVSGAVPRKGHATSEYKSFGDITRHGQQLEHFHSYFRGKHSVVKDMTIDFHTDQGLFIAFVPPVMVNAAGELTGDKPGEFLLKTKSGAVVEAQYPNDGAVIAFMIGDGAYQYMNRRIVGAKTFRATPHAFQMPQKVEQSSFRSWYGRMFLPPTDAVSKYGMTYGDMRSQSIAATRKIGDAATNVERVLTMGCSGPNQFARHLAATDCGANQMYCWHQCMNYTATASPEVCKSQNLNLQCMSQYNQVADVNVHGDFEPMCSNVTEIVTPFPTAAPRASTCKDVDFTSFKKAHYGYTKLNGNMSLFWNVEDGMVDGKLVYNGRVGWIAGGVANPTGGLGGMLGAQVLIGRFDSEFKANYVEEFKIHDKSSAFRFWNTSLAQSVSAKNVTLVDGCYTVLSFKTKTFGNYSLDLTTEAKNKFIWGCEDPATSKKELQYHGRANRGVVEVNFNLANGGVSANETDSGKGSKASDSNASPKGSTATTSSDEKSTGVSWTVFGLMLVAIGVLVVIVIVLMATRSKSAASAQSNGMYQGILSPDSRLAANGGK